ncbi:hypothetical protein [Amycolatopsis sp. GA6-003]|uniref:hypothetical protein n=1 Tax=Amycolatopsis sp. GA6-003 TaxID=2652444 RepID=UPI003917560C
MLWSRVKFWGLLVVFAGLLVLSLVSLNQTDVTCGGETMRAGDTCVSRGVNRGREDQESENNGRNWIGIAIGGLGVLGYAAYGVFELRDRRKAA